MDFRPREMGKAAEVSSGGGWRPVSVAAAKGITVLIILFLLLAWSAEYLASRIPDAWEGRLAALLPQESAQQDSPQPSLKKAAWPQSEPDAERVERIMQKLRSTRTAGAWRDLDYKISIAAPGDGPNAYAILGGQIVVTPELLEVLKTERGLAFVIAHEIAHHEQRHILKSNVKGLAVGIVFYFLGVGAGDSTLANSASLPLLSGSREMEESADLYALRLVYEAYGTVENADEFFLWAQENSPDIKWLTWASTHPHPDQRLAILMEEMKAYATPSKEPPANLP